MSSESPLRLFFPHKPGTKNLVHRFPFVSISLGLIYKKHPVLNVTYSPLSGLPLHWGSKDMARVSPRTKELLLSAPRPLAGFDRRGVGLRQIADRRRIENRALLAFSTLITPIKLKAAG